MGNVTTELAAATKTMLDATAANQHELLRRTAETTQLLESGAAAAARALNKLKDVAPPPVELSARMKELADVVGRLGTDRPLLNVLRNCAWRCASSRRAWRSSARSRRRHVVYDPRQMSGVRAVGSFDDASAAPTGDASLTITAANLVDAQGRRAKALRLLRPRIRAVVDWWRRSISP